MNKKLMRLLGISNKADQSCEDKQEYLYRYRAQCKTLRCVQQAHNFAIVSPVRMMVACK